MHTCFTWRRCFCDRSEVLYLATILVSAENLFSWLEVFMFLYKCPKVTPGTSTLFLSSLFCTVILTYLSYIMTKGCAPMCCNTAQPFLLNGYTPPTKKQLCKGHSTVLTTIIWALFFLFLLNLCPPKPIQFCTHAKSSNFIQVLSNSFPILTSS